MDLFPLDSRRRTNSIAACIFGLLFWLTVPQAACGATNTPPSITRDPLKGIAGPGEDFAFSVMATGTPPLTYQWRFAGANLSGQTNASLLLTNLAIAQSGAYSVTVGNIAGNAVSSNASLLVQANVPRRLGTGRIIQVGAQVGVPITLRANGRESAVSFSLLYNTNAYANPVFLAANSNAAANLNLTQPGSVGLALTLPPGETFPAGYQWLGVMQFDLAAGSGPLQGRLAYATNPVPVAAANTNALSLVISASVQPQYVVGTSNAQLRPQSGLFEQQLIISNPGATVMTNLDILTLNLSVDSQTNAITFYNGQATLTAFPFGDPLLDVVCDCSCGFYLDAASNSVCDFNGYLTCGSGDCSLDFKGTNASFAIAQINNLLPGESRGVTIEFYVTDHVTIPRPKYSLFLADPLLLVPPANATSLTITTNRYVNGTFLVEFSTTLGRLYYVQYAGTLGALATNALTALPPVAGTGSRVQWIDNGPPKTMSSPMNGSRFYRVLQSP